MGKPRWQEANRDEQVAIIRAGATAAGCTVAGVVLVIFVLLSLAAALLAY